MHIYIYIAIDFMARVFVIKTSLDLTPAGHKGRNPETLLTRMYITSNIYIYVQSYKVYMDADAK